MSQRNVWNIIFLHFEINFQVIWVIDYCTSYFLTRPARLQSPVNICNLFQTIVAFVTYAALEDRQLTFFENQTVSFQDIPDFWFFCGSRENSVKFFSTFHKVEKCIGKLIRTTRSLLWFLFPFFKKNHLSLLVILAPQFLNDFY
jgi:hypothetical protein